MPLPLLLASPLFVPAAAAGVGVFVGSRIASSDDANVVVNAAPTPSITGDITRLALLGGASLIAISVLPQILGSKKR